MSYRYYNANAMGKFESDCTVRALSCATGKSWDYIYEHLSDIAQAQGTMMDDRKFIIDYLDRRYKRVPYVSESVKKMADKYCNNIILITMNGHITCAKYRNYL